MADTMIEIDVEDLMGLMKFEKPVLRGAVTDGVLLNISDDVLEIESFTSTGIVQPLVYGVGVLRELDIEEVFVAPGMNGEKPVLWQPENAGASNLIPIGAVPPWPGDAMALLDFDEGTEIDINIGINQGTIFVGINSRQGVVLGSLVDSIAGFYSLGLIDFIVSDQYIDRME
jgi:hypothetical protein